MKLLATLILVLTQTACAVTTVASTASYIATDKTLTDHAASLVVPNAQCSTSHLFQRKYYCEQTPVYNQNGL